MSTSDAINLSSSRAVINCLSNVKNTSLQKNKWLYRNRYSKDTINVFEREGRNTFPIYPDKLLEYISVSSIIHCLDGWKFISHSVSNLLEGDQANSIFFSYYAQIRALMSIFAIEGIGVFNLSHRYFDSNNDCKSFAGNTHTVIRDLTKDYGESITKGKKILDYLKFENKTFSEWVNAANFILASPIITETAKDWLYDWSLDIRTLNNDHDARNEASYRPQGIHKYHSNHTSREFLNITMEIWSALEPIGSNYFNNLDLHLLRKTLMHIYTKKTGKSPRGKVYEDLVRNAFITLGLNPNNQYFELLSNRVPIGNCLILTEAKKYGFTQFNGLQPIPIFCRALILLRLCTGAIENLLKTCGINKQDVDFSLSEFENVFGLWATNSPPVLLTDLWEDIENSIEDIDKWLILNPSREALSEIKYTNSLQYMRLNQFIRAGLWGTGL